MASCECQYFRDWKDVCKHIWAVLLETERSGFLGLARRAWALPAACRHGIVGIPPMLTPRRGRGRNSLPTSRWRSRGRSRVRRRHGSAMPRSSMRSIATRRWPARPSRSISCRASGRRKADGDARSGSAWRRRDVPYLPDAVDREILALLLGASDPSFASYPGDEGRGSFHMGEPLLHRVLPTIVRSGRAVLRVHRQPGEELIPLTWDDGPPWVFRLDVGHPSRDASISIDGALVRDSERLLIREPTMILPSGYLVHAGRVARFDARGAFTLLAQLRGTGPLAIPPGATGQLVDVLARSGDRSVRTPRRAAVRNRRQPATPDRTNHGGPRAPRARRSSHRSRSSTAGAVVDSEAGATMFDRDKRRLVRRDTAAEDAAMKRLAELGFQRRWDFARARSALRISAGQLPRVVRELSADGWRVEAEGRAFRPAQSMRSEVRSGIDWFELHGAVDFGEGLSAPLPKLLEALRQGRTTVVLDDGSEGMMPEEWLRRFAGIATAGETSGRPPALQDDAGGAPRRGAGERAGGPRRREVPARARRAGDARRRGSAPLDSAAIVRRHAARLSARRARLVRVSPALRLRRLPGRRHGARQDGHGAGLARPPARPARSEGPVARRRPAIVVFNWIEEAARFAPELKVLDFSGAGPIRRPRAQSSPRADDLRHAPPRRAAAEGRRVRLRDPRRGAGDQEREHRWREGGAAAARAPPPGAQRHAGGEPPRRAVEPVRVPQPRDARHVFVVRAARRRRRAARPRGARRAGARRAAVHPAADESAGRPGTAVAQPS